MFAYVTVFFTSLLASTLIPISSEISFIAFLYKGYSPFALCLTATIGNTLGACINAYIGRYFTRFKSSKYFPVTEAQWQSAENYFKKYGMWSLLFSWLPIIGDALSFVAGAFKVNPYIFLIFITTGKAARYGFIAFLIS